MTITGTGLNVGNPEMISAAEVKKKHRSSDVCLFRVNEHIDSFLIKVIHYTSVERSCLDTNLTISCTYRLFKRNYSNSVKYRAYRDYFNKNFNFTFACTRVDACNK